ncbi:EamA family transporter [Bradyrhizobium sp. USDA 4508]
MIFDQPRNPWTGFVCVRESERGKWRSTSMLAIMCQLVAAAMHAGLFAFAKALGAAYPVGEIVFVRSVFAMVPVLWLVWWVGGWRVLHTERLGVHLVRSALGTCALFLAYMAVRMLPLGMATALTYTVPLFITMFAVPLLGEIVSFQRWAVVLVGFVGVLLVVHPNVGSTSFGIVIALAGR